MDISDWIDGARPKTLPAALAPVLVGTGVATWHSSSDIPRAALAAVVALALQVGVNYANDYSDGIRGTDGPGRKGPRRLVGSGAAKPVAVKWAAFGAFGVAALAGIILLAITGQWWLLIVGAACIAAAWYYTGGKKPYGYAGMGEAAVFVFFGLVATVGTTYTQIDTVPLVTWVLAAGCGAMSVALLMINNLRDRVGDERSGKRTLAVRLGNKKARAAFAATLGFAAAMPLLAGALTMEPFMALGALAGILVVAPARSVMRGASGVELLQLLGTVGKATAVYGLIVGAAVAAA